MTAAPAAPIAGAQAAKAPAKIKSESFFSVQRVTFDAVADEETAYFEQVRILKKITRRSIILTFLSGILIFSLPMFQPLYKFYALDPHNNPTPMMALPLPNLTNHAVLSWAAASVTEILTIGFGDFETKLLAQKMRFTHDGWEAFVKAFLSAKIDESFRKHQLVLTTVPSDTPVIVSQGQNEKHVYEWHLQIPVIMTYATNNNVTRPERQLIDLTVRRVPYVESPSGIAIDTWKQKKP